jgi:toxin ParE1/3/4
MFYEISLTKDAERELEEIYLYIAEHDSRAGISEYRQIFFKPCRLTYRVHSKRVIIYVITDGRRDMGSLLARRLLGA